ncbi:MAG: NADH-quinone oxidoreductase subunit A [Candidatus Omnitrophica bacterium]|nr:NADH-quinone oxidoreductase subunit A [Candidatus Omnitrophota bacterium]
MDSYFYHYLFIGIFVLATVGFAVLPLALAGFIRPRKPSLLKQAPYECGVEPVGDPWIQFRVQYYLVALAFVIFDVETIYLYPWAVGFHELGLPGFVEMIIFLAILAAGLLYAWKKKALEWD